MSSTDQPLRVPVPKRIIPSLLSWCQPIIQTEQMKQEIAVLQAQIDQLKAQQKALLDASKITVTESVETKT